MENINVSFPAFVRDQIEKKREALSQESYYAYKAALTKLLKFKRDIDFHDITEELIYSYRKWMLAIGNCENTASKSLRTLRTFVNLAVRYAYMSKNPFQYLRIKKCTGQREFLTRDEFLHLFDVYNAGGLAKIEADILRYFLLSCLTGLRYSDIRRVNVSDIKDGILSIKMQKTGMPVSIPISSKAAALIDEGPWPRIYCNKVTNRILKGLITRAGIEKKVTFHVARHTFATISITLGMPIEVVSKLLGHTDIKTTQIYAKVVDSVKQKEMSKWDSL